MLVDVDLRHQSRRHYPLAEGDARRSGRMTSTTPGAPRLRLLSFDVDTTGHDPTRPVLEQHTRRWSRADLLTLDDHCQST
jgi:hypothetical protein